MRRDSDDDAEADGNTSIIATTASSGSPSPSTGPAVPLAAPVTFQGTIPTVSAEQRHQFSAAAGQQLYMAADQPCNPSLRYEVHGPSDELVSGYGHGGCEATDRFPAVADGTYTIVVTSNGVTGPYALTVRPIRPDGGRPGEVGASVAGTIDGPGARDVFPFELHAGDLIYLDGVASCGPTTIAKYQLYDAAGAPQLGFDTDVCQDWGRVAIQADGRYD